MPEQGKLRHIWIALLLSALAGCDAHAQGVRTDWNTSWASAQTAPYGTEVLPAGSFDGATLREVVHLSAGGSRLAVRISNAFGASPLELESVYVGLRAPGARSAAAEPSSERALSFHGLPAVSVPAGAEYLSDPIAYPTAALADLVVALHIRHAPAVPTVHAGAHATALLQPKQPGSGPQPAAPVTFTRWYFLSGVLVAGDAPAHANGGVIVAFGDSITDGHGSTTDGNDRWPDVLARRLQGNPAYADVAVINEGIGGNRILADGIGPGAMARLERDVLAQTGARTALVLEGINDLGGLDRTEAHAPAVHEQFVTSLEMAFTQMAEQMHQHGLRIIAGTLTPFIGSDYYHPSPATESDRQALNQWIRSSGTFDGVVDFDAALRDPAHPDHLLPAYDSGDHLHPGPAGYQRMGDLIPLSLLLPGRGNPQP